MLNKTIKTLKIRHIKTSGALLAVIAVMFFIFSPNVGHAQYYYGNQYTYPYNYSEVYVSTTGVNNITSVSAIINGLVSGTGSYNTSNVVTWFEYGPTANLGNYTIRNNTSSGYSSFTANITMLNPNTLYYFRAAAQGPQGIVYGNVSSFRTNYGSFVIYPNNNYNNPNYATLTAITNSATFISSSGAALNSLILTSMNDPATNAWFEYGTNLNLSNTTTPQAIGTMPSAKHVNTMTGLLPGTTYYFRAVAANSSTRINGAVLSFTTSGVMQNTYTPTPAITSTDEISKANTPTAAPRADAVQSPLSASVFGSGPFLPVSIFGWLVLLILVLILILLIKHPHVRFWSNHRERDHEWR